MTCKPHCEHGSFQHAATWSLMITQRKTKQSGSPEPLHADDPSFRLKQAMQGTEWFLKPVTTVQACRFDSNCNSTPVQFTGYRFSCTKGARAPG